MLQVVPTEYSDLKNHTIATNQYSVTEHFKESNIPRQHNLPGVFFYYDMSPIKVPPPLPRPPPCGVLSKRKYDSQACKQLVPEQLVCYFKPTPECLPLE